MYSNDLMIVVVAATEWNIYLRIVLYMSTVIDSNVVVESKEKEDG